MIKEIFNSQTTSIMGEAWSEQDESLPGTKSKPHKCPVCNGTGKVCRQIAEIWRDANYRTFHCNACKETGVVWSPA